MTEGELL